MCEMKQGLLEERERISVVPGANNTSNIYSRIVEDYNIFSIYFSELHDI